LTPSLVIIGVNSYCGCFVVVKTALAVSGRMSAMTVYVERVLSVLSRVWHATVQVGHVRCSAYVEQRGGSVLQQSDR